MTHERDQQAARQLAGLELHELLTGVRQRISRAIDAQEQLDDLLEAMLAVSSELDIDATLRQIMHSAVTLVNARYGALGVRGGDGTLSRFIHYGLDDHAARVIGAPPKGHGLLGELFTATKPVRLDDVTTHPTGYGFPANHPRMRSFLGVPIRSGGAVFGNLYLAEKAAGAPFTQDDEAIVEALAAAAGVAIDNARLYESVRQNQHRLAATSEISTQLLGGTEPHEALTLITRKAAELAGTPHAVVAVAGESGRGESLTVDVAVDAGPDIAAGTVLPIEGSVCGQVYQANVGRRVDELAVPTEAGPVARFGPALLVPLRALDTTFGVLVTARGRGGTPFTDENLRLAESFTDQTALAYQLGRTHARTRELDVLADRDRIARDLHDHIIQRLFATGLALERTGVMARVPEVRERIAAALDSLQDIVTEMRDTISDLHRGRVGATKLRSRLQDAAADVVGDAVLRVTVRMAGPLDVVDDELADAAEAVVREAVGNVVAHAGAGRAMLTVSVADDLTIDVTDDGVWRPDTPLAGTPHGSGGLADLALRAERGGGSLRVTPAKGTGTKLVWSVPLP
ncbi:MAG: GAF domain-containing protein [Actinophytocola sp.]|nr:GAF domain-containing protein [Actinophytocola sp.]